MPIYIQADHRENASGIPQLLTGNAGVSVCISTLPIGDYIINGTIGVERKSAEDFVQSIISKRLFNQIARLKRSVSRSLLIVEGNPYNTAHKIQAAAIRGAVLSILVSWQTPIIFSKDREDTVAILLMMALQNMSAVSHLTAPKNYRFKKLASRQLFFLQGVPGVGPALAALLLEKFGNLKAAVNASEAELRKVKGVGKLKAKTIFGFINGVQGSEP